MNMTPIYSVGGQLLGHLDMSECGQNRHSVTVTDSMRSLMALPMISDGELKNETVRYFNIPFRVLRFRYESDEQRVRYLVVGDLPDWFWDTYSTVKFSPDHWEG